MQLDKNTTIDILRERYNMLATEQALYVTEIEDAKKIRDTNGVKIAKFKLEIIRKQLAAIRKMLYS